MKAAIYTLQSKYYKSQMLVAAFALFLQRSPVVRIAAAVERTVKVPFARLAQLVAVAFTASSIPQSVTGATTFSSNPTSPTTAKTGESFNLVFAVTGAPSTVASWKVIGTLPQGLSIPGLSGQTLNSKVGSITGTPTETGTFQITAQPYSKANLRGDTNKKAYPISITVEQGTVVVPTTTFTASPSSTTSGVISQNFSQSFSIAGITAASWEILGTVPPGLAITGPNGETPFAGTLNAVSGTISGKPTSAGTYNLTVQAYDAANLKGVTDNKQYPLKITISAPITSFTATPSSTETGEVGQSFSQSFSIAGITAASWKVLGTLPPGLSVAGPNGETLSGSTLNAVSGSISGTPTTAGTYNLTVQAYDAADRAGYTDGTAYPLHITISERTFQSPFEEWSFNHFGTVSAPVDGDLDHDGFNNLLEYALGLDPNVSDNPQALKQTISSQGAETRFTTSFERVPGQTDIDIVVETTPALDQAWTPIATSVQGAPFNGSASIQESAASNTSIQVTIQDTVPSSSNLQCFQRVRVVKN